MNETITALTAEEAIREAEWMERVMECVTHPDHTRG